MQDIQILHEQWREEGINRIECHNKERYYGNKMDSDEAEKENIVRTIYGRVICNSDGLIL